MNDQDQRNEKFDHVKGKIKETWSRLNDDEIALYKNGFDQFLNVLEEKYGLGKEEAESKLKQIEWAAKRGSEKAA